MDTETNYRGKRNRRGYCTCIQRCISSDSFQGNAVLTLLVIGYMCFGAAVFMKMEDAAPAVNETSLMLNISNALWETRNLTFDIWHENVQITLKTYLLYNHCDDVNYENPMRHFNFMTALFLCMTAITTIGYGTVTPKTMEGRLFLTFYSVLGIPLFLLFVSNFGLVVAATARDSFKGVRKVARKTSRRVSRTFNDHRRRRTSHQGYHGKAVRRKGLDHTKSWPHDDGVIEMVETERSQRLVNDLMDEENRRRSSFSSLGIPNPVEDSTVEEPRAKCNEVADISYHPRDDKDPGCMEIHHYNDVCHDRFKAPSATITPSNSNIESRENKTRNPDIDADDQNERTSRHEEQTSKSQRSTPIHEIIESHTVDTDKTKANCNMEDEESGKSQKCESAIEAKPLDEPLTHQNDDDEHEGTSLSSHGTVYATSSKLQDKILVEDHPNCSFTSKSCCHGENQTPRGDQLCYANEIEKDDSDNDDYYEKDKYQSMSCSPKSSENNSHENFVSSSTDDVHLMNITPGERTNSLMKPCERSEDVYIDNVTNCSIHHHNKHNSIGNDSHYVRKISKEEDIFVICEKCGFQTLCRHRHFSNVAKKISFQIDEPTDVQNSLSNSPINRDRRASALSAETIETVDPHDKALGVLTVTYILYTLGGSWLFVYWEARHKWSYVDAFYFCVTTLTTIGFGDLMLDLSDPDHRDRIIVYKTLLFIIYACVGLILLSACFSLAQEKIKTAASRLMRNLGITQWWSNFSGNCRDCCCCTRFRNRRGSNEKDAGNTSDNNLDDVV
ncbi:uncharacterized protein LOC144436839 [Glandiceps talaboti]